VSLLPRVLFVDDEPRVLSAFELDLFEEFDVHTATSGPEGLDILASSEDFAVVVSDMRMPRMDGAEFLARVKQQHPQAVRILLTGYADMNAVVAAVNAGNIFRYLQKPCPRSMIVEALTDAVAEHRRRIEETERAQHAIRDTQRLIDSLSHELNTPLAVVQGLAQALREGTVEIDSGEHAELLDLIAEQSAELTATIKDLMVVGRSAVGGLTMSEDVIDVVALLRSVSAASGETIRIEGAPTFVSADAARLRSVLELLIDNALVHGASPVTASVAQLPYGVSIMVRDGGPGVPESIAATMFEPFVTGTGDRPGKATGGLGLSVARGLVGAMGGSIGYHRLAASTIFEVVLPSFCPEGDDPLGPVIRA
jgi:signal transduction histidine kinase